MRYGKEAMWQGTVCELTECIIREISRSEIVGQGLWSSLFPLPVAVAGCSTRCTGYSWTGQPRVQLSRCRGHLLRRLCPAGPMCEMTCRPGHTTVPPAN